jgi:NAD(P)-dependent dehydrogenase (short-subunit alcohol dehydrogenase family)
MTIERPPGPRRPRHRRLAQHRPGHRRRAGRPAAPTSSCTWRTDTSAGAETVAAVEGARAAGGARFSGDLSDPETAARVVAGRRSGAFGWLDVVVNNAAIRPEAAFADITFADWRKVMGDRARRRLPRLARHALPHLLEQSDQAAIVNLGGLTGHTGAAHRDPCHHREGRRRRPDQGPGARACRRKGITVNCVAPGLIETKRAHRQRRRRAQAPRQPQDARRPPRAAGGGGGSRRLSRRDRQGATSPARPCMSTAAPTSHDPRIPSCTLAGGLARLGRGRLAPVSLTGVPLAWILGAMAGSADLGQCGRARRQDEICAPCSASC